jgi:hypothetical protein
MVEEEVVAVVGEVVAVVGEVVAVVGEVVVAAEKDLVHLSHGELMQMKTFNISSYNSKGYYYYRKYKSLLLNMPVRKDYSCLVLRDCNTLQQMYLFLEVVN